MTVYLPGIPLPTDLISSSGPEFKTNFTQLNSQFGVDHIPFNNSGSNGTGLHKQVTMPITTTPASQTDPQAVWHLVKSASTIFTQYSLPFFKNQTGDLPMLPDVVGSGSNWGFKFGQMIFNFGGGSIPQDGSAELTTWAIPFTTQTFSILACKNGATSGVSALTLTISAEQMASPNSLLGGIFKTSVNLVSGNMGYYYLAIGY